MKFTDKAKVDDLLEQRPICDSRIRPEQPLQKLPPQNEAKQICLIVDFEAEVVAVVGVAAVVVVAVVVVKTCRTSEHRGCRDEGWCQWRVEASPDLNRDV